MPLQIVRQDITKMRVDAIVNTTNREMIGYSGVDLAVHTAAGPGLDEECSRLPPLGLGQALITGGYHLPCKYVIHTSGPIWQGGGYGESSFLRSCYLESLKLAVKHDCKSVAFPLISAGVYGYPKDQVLKFAVQTITEFLFENELLVYLCVFDKSSYLFSKKLFNDIIEFIEDTYADEHCYEYRSVRFAEADMSLLDDYPSPRAEFSVKKHRVCASMLPPEKKKKPPREDSFADTLEEYLKQKDKGFREMLFDLIDERGISDVECYKRANVDKRVFSKIKSNKGYKPSKQTAVAFAISLRLDLEQTQELLATAGMTLSRNSIFDKIIRYFIHNGNYDIFEINEALFEFDQLLLGSGTVSN